MTGKPLLMLRISLCHLNLIKRDTLQPAGSLKPDAAINAVWPNEPPGCPRQLSGGQQQRVGTARSLTVEPDLRFLDEPFGALDPLICREMQEGFLRIQRQLKKTIIFITHDFVVAIRPADRIAIMKDGGGGSDRHAGRTGSGPGPGSCRGLHRSCGAGLGWSGCFPRSST